MKETLIHYKKEILFSLFFILLGTVFGLGTNYFTVKTNTIEEKDFSGTKFPDLSLKSYTENLNLSDVLAKNKVLVVYISTKCSACHKEIKILSENDLYEKFGIKVVFISYDSAEEVRKFVEENKLKNDIFFDPNNQLLKTLEIRSTPTNLLIENGEITKSWVGMPSDATNKYIYKKLGIS